MKVGAAWEPRLGVLSRVEAAAVAWARRRAAQPGKVARAAGSAAAGLKHPPDAGGQGLWRGALCSTAHRQALGSQGASCGGANGCKL